MSFWHYIVCTKNKCYCIRGAGEMGQTGDFFKNEIHKHILWCDFLCLNKMQPVTLGNYFFSYSFPNNDPLILQLPFLRELIFLRWWKSDAIKSDHPWSLSWLFSLMHIDLGPVLVPSHKVPCSFIRQETDRHWLMSFPSGVSLSNNRVKIWQALHLYSPFYPAHALLKS